MSAIDWLFEHAVLGCFGCKPPDGQVEPLASPQLQRAGPSLMPANEACTANSASDSKESEDDVVICFTDIQDSTRLWQALPNEMPIVLTMHDAAMRALIEAHNGYEVKTEGDAFMVSFQSVLDATEFAAALQLALLDCDWPAAVLKHPSCLEQRNDAGHLLWRGPRIRVGLHVGPVIRKEVLMTGLYGGKTIHKADFFGQTVNIAARVSSLAAGGQTIVSESFKLQADLFVMPGNARRAWWFAQRGMQILKGISHPVICFELVVGAIAGRHFPAFKRMMSPRSLSTPPGAQSPGISSLSQHSYSKPALPPTPGSREDNEVISPDTSQSATPPPLPGTPPLSLLVKRSSAAARFGGAAGWGDREIAAGGEVQVR